MEHCGKEAVAGLDGMPRAVERRALNVSLLANEIPKGMPRVKSLKKNLVLKEEKSRMFCAETASQATNN